MSEADVRVSWRIGGEDPATACAAAGAESVRIFPMGTAEVAEGEDVPCAAGAATVRGWYWDPPTTTAGHLGAMLLDGSGAPLTGVDLPVDWREGRLEVEVAFAVPAETGRLRYRLCRAMVAQPTFVEAAGPTWSFVTVHPRDREVILGGLAPGRYAIVTYHQYGGAYRYAIADVVAGTEVLIVDPCVP